MMKILVGGYHQHNIKQNTVLTTSHDSFSTNFTSLLHEEVIDHYCYKKMCASWVPKILTHDNKQNVVENLFNPLLNMTNVYIVIG